MTLVWLLTYCLGAAASFVNPLFGTLTYLFEYYLRPNLHWWGLPLPDLRWNFLISTILTATFVARRNSLLPLVKANHGPAGFLLGLAALMALLSPFAVDSAISFSRMGDYLKLVLFSGLIVGTVRSAWAFDAFIGVHLLGAGWWGWEVYLDPKREYSRLYNIGSGDTLGDNLAAIHLLAVLPFAIVYALSQRDKISRGIAVLVSPFVINAFILCNSRGAMIGFLAATGSAFFITKPGHRLRAVGAGVILAIGFYALADAEFIERQQSTVNYEQDGSATSRLESWRGGFALIQDYPLGAGGGGYHRLSPIYIADIVQAHDGQQRAPHNTFVLVASEWGLPGLALFLGFYYSCFRLLSQVRRTSPEGGMWYYRSVAVQMALVGILVAGTFSDRLYGEAPYWMGGLAVALHRLNADRLAKQKAAGESAPSTAGVPRSPLHPVAARIAAAHAEGA
jgi:O-antigen ligase